MYVDRMAKTVKLSGSTFNMTPKKHQHLLAKIGHAFCGINGHLDSGSSLPPHRGFYSMSVTQSVMLCFFFPGASPLTYL